MNLSGHVTMSAGRVQWPHVHQQRDWSFTSAGLPAQSPGAVGERLGICTPEFCTSLIHCFTCRGELDERYSLRRGKAYLRRVRRRDLVLSRIGGSVEVDALDCTGRSASAHRNERAEFCVLLGRGGAPGTAVGTVPAVKVV